VPATAEEPAALASRRLPAVQHRCNAIWAAACVQDVISGARLKLFSCMSDAEHSGKIQALA